MGENCVAVHFRNPCFFCRSGVMFQWAWPGNLELNWWFGTLLGETSAMNGVWGKYGEGVGFTGRFKFGLDWRF